VNKERKIFWTAMAFVLAVGCFVLWSQFTRRPAEMISVAKNSPPKQSQPTDAIQKQNQSGQIISVVSVPDPEVLVAPVPVVSPPADEAEPFLRQFDPKLLADPELEDFIRDRLWLALDQLNNPLMQKLGLTDDEIAKFKNLAVSNLVAAAEQGSESMEQGSAATESAIDEALVAQQANFESQLHQLLGDARFAQYENGIEDYSQFFGVKFLAGNAPLPNSQVEEVVSVMQSERNAVNAAAAKIQAADFAPLTADDYLQMQELIVGRTYDRLTNILPAQQLTAFGQFELQQLDSFRAKVNPGDSRDSSQ
jgi:hypothetical protein